MPVQVNGLRAPQDNRNGFRLRRFMILLNVWFFFGVNAPALYIKIVKSEFWKSFDVFESVWSFPGLNLPPHFAFRMSNASRELCLRECHWLQDCRAVTYKEAFNGSCRHYRHTPAHWEYSAHTDRKAVVYLKKSLFHANATMKGRKFYQLSSIAMNLTEAVAFCDQLSTERMSHLAATYERPPKPSFKGMLEERYQLASEASRLREKSSKSSPGIFYQTITSRSKLESQDNGPVRLRSSSYVRTYHIYDGHHKVALLNSSAKGFAFCEYNPLMVDKVSVLAFTGYPAFDVDIDLREIVYSWN